MRLSSTFKTSLAIVVVFAVGTTGYMIIEHMNFADAFYMTTITVTTIGFQEVHPLSPEGRFFTIILAFAGVGVILVVASAAAKTVLEGKLKMLIGFNPEEKMIRKLTDHIVVCGYGRTGRAVVEVLQARKERFVVVEADRESCKALEEQHIPFLYGDSTKEDILLAAHVERAKTFLPCLSDDAHNVFAILLARQLNPSITIIARAVEEGSEARLHLAGANRVINPYRIGGMRLALTAINPTVADFIDTSLPGSSMELELSEYKITEGCQLAGSTLAGADFRKRFGVIVVAINRNDGGTFNPGPNEELKAGDVLVTLGPIKEQEALQKALAN